MLFHPEKLRCLAWLRLTMLTRSFQRRRRLLIGTLLAGLLLLGMAIGTGQWLFLALTRPDWFNSTGRGELLYVILTATQLIWLIMPMLAYTSNEGLDITKLQLFPLTRLEIMWSLLFSSMFGLGTVFLAVFFGIIIVALGIHSLAVGLLALMILIVFYISMVSISQLILTLLMSILQRRRLRDLSILLLALVSSSLYLFIRLTFMASNGQNIAQMFDEAHFSPYLQWLPSGVAAGALRTAQQGNWDRSFALLGLLTLITLLALYLWQRVLESSMSASESGASRSTRRQLALVATVAPPTSVSTSSGITPSSLTATLVSSDRIAESEEMSPSVRFEVHTKGQIRAVSGQSSLKEQLQTLVGKELTCFWRDPLLKVLIFRRVIYLALVVFLNVSKTHQSGLNPIAMPLLTLVLVFFFVLSISLNSLGIERQGLSTLLLFPVDRRRLLWGKNIAAALLGLIALFTMLILNAVLSKQLTMLLPATLIGLIGFGVVLGCANLISVCFPRYQPELGRRSLSSAGNQVQAGGCLSILSALCGSLVTLILLVPVVLGIVLPYILNRPLIWLVGVSLSLAYGIGFYLILTNLSAHYLLKRETEILALTTREL